MKTSDNPLLRMRLEDEDRRKMEKLASRLLVIGGVIFLIGLIGILIAPLSEEQVDKATFVFIEE